MKTSKYLSTALILASACAALAAPAAQAELIITLTEALDGGVDLTATGTSDGIVGGDNTAQFRFEYGILSADDAHNANSFSGSFEVASNTYAIINVRLSAFNNDEGAETIVKFDTLNNVTPTGTVTANNISADFPASDLAFATLNPGTYSSTNVAGVSLVVVPEPSSLALLGLGGLLIARRPRINAY